MTPSQQKKLNCKECQFYFEPKDGFPLGTCTEAIGWVHSIEKMEECPLIEEKEYDDS